MLRRIISLMLVLALCLSLSVMATAEETAPIAKEFKSIELDFDTKTHNMEWEAGKTYTPSANTWISGMYIDANCNYTVVNDPEDVAHGNYLSYAGGQVSGNKLTIFGVQAFSQDKIQLKFDMKLTGTDGVAGGIDFRTRRTKPTNEPQEFKIADGKFQNKTFNANTWYTFCFTYDFVNETRSIVVLKADGSELYNSGDLAYKWGSYTNVSHHRMFASASAGTVSVDNIEFTEWVNWPALESIKDGAGSETIDYNANTLTLGMTKAMVVDSEKIKITRDIDGSEVAITNAVADESDSKKIVLTLGTPLQSASTYTVTLSGDMQMSFRTLEIGEAIVKKFTTASRPSDMTGVTFTPSAGSVSFAAELINTTDTDKNMMVLMTSFDSTGRLFKTAFVPVTVLAGTTGDSPTIAPIVNVEVPEGGSVKAFVLGDILTFSPLNNNIHTFSLE